MNEFSLMGTAQGLASMLAQNTNQPVPDVEQVGDAVRFVAETASGWVRVTVENVEWADGQPYTPEAVYDHDPRPRELRDDTPDSDADSPAAAMPGMFRAAVIETAADRARRAAAELMVALLVIEAANDHDS